jgi:AcrR family transcriptional regulator
LTADDWIDAALVAIAEAGIAGVAVEPLAIRLGATKGSFYWHFANRDALLVAALERWEQRYTQKIIESVEAGPDPGARLRDILVRAIRHVGRDPLQARLLGAADHPLAADVVRRVVARRIDYLVEKFEQFGFPTADARHRAVLMYTAYVGHEQLALRLPGAIQVGEDYIDAIIGVALGRPDAGKPPVS